MYYHIENLFPTPIYSCFLENQKEVQSDIANALIDIQYDDADHYNQLGTIFETTPASNDIIAEKQMTNVDQAIDRHVKQYCDEIGFRAGVYTRTSWITKTSLGGHTLIHTHGTADISGVYYFQTTGNDGDIFFISPVTTAISSLCYQKYIERKSHRPEVGKLLLFPGWLEHGVKTNTVDSDRIVLAFSISFAR
jgi:uncharacterized protein (TIGR02466 family)